MRTSIVKVAAIFFLLATAKVFAADLSAARTDTAAACSLTQLQITPALHHAQ